MSIGIYARQFAAVAGVLLCMTSAAATADTQVAAPRIPYGDIARLSAEDQEAIGDNPANVMRMLANASPGVFHGILLLGNGLYKESTLPPRLRELAVLRVGYLSNAGYEIWQHEALARTLGFTDRELTAIRTGEGGGVLDPAQTAVLHFVDDVVRHVRAGDATLSAVRQHLDDRQLIDLLAVTGLYMTISRILETTGVPLDAAPADWKKELGQSLPDQR
ncbi:carboxymuconolactone decarboxylase family protein [soil metagenome]